MKNPKLALTAALVILLVVVISVFLSVKQPEKNTQSEQDISTKPEVSTKLPEKNNSFSVNQPESNSTDPELTATIAKGKNYLITQVDNRLKQLSTFKSMVENTSGFAETERKMILAELNDEISQLVALKPEINQSETKEDVQVVAEKVKAVWLQSRNSVDKAQGKLLEAQQQSAIAEAENYAAGINKRITILKASGQSTQEMEKLLVDYNQKIEEAKQSSDLAVETLQKIKDAATDGEKENLRKEKERLLKDYQSHLKEAYNLLREEARQEFSERFKGNP